ncbi:OTU deubiquitinase with linear linkage specificity a [Electrophorus electricus]|nr:OTU deubiquitinase with linear linkage specificity a [Electrophorus electricus]
MSSDDVFDEDMDDISLQNKEWSSNMEKRTKDGFRDGVDAGKEASLQVGFNLGYREGAIKIKAVGQLKGIISAVQCWTQSRASGSAALSSVTELLRRVERHEEDLLEAMRRVQEQPPVSMSEVVGDLEELFVGRRDQGGSFGCCQGDHASSNHCGRDEESRSSLQAEDAAEGLPGIHSQGSLLMRDSLEQLLHSCTVLLTEMGLPEELTHHVQQLIYV